MEVWEHNDKLYEVSSSYRLPDHVWTHELRGLTGPPGTGPHLTVSVPGDAPARHLMVHFGPGSIPWPVLRRFHAQVLGTSGPPAEVEGNLHLSSNAWRCGEERCEVNAFHFSERDAWCYELCVPDPDPDVNNYLYVLVPDVTPNGPFTPATVDQVVLTPHGEVSVSWHMFTHFMTELESSGDITT